MATVSITQNARLNDEVEQGKAKTAKTTFHRETSISIEIKASAAIVWALLTKASDYSRWNSTVTSFGREDCAG